MESINTNLGRTEFEDVLLDNIQEKKFFVFIDSNRIFWDSFIKEMYKNYLDGEVKSIKDIAITTCNTVLNMLKYSVI